MVTPQDYLKANYVLQHFTSGQIQAHAAVDQYIRYSTQPHSIIHTRRAIVPGTHIPASTIHRFQTGVFKLGPISAKKLSLFYERYMQRKLRSVGARKEDARRYCKDVPVKNSDRIRKYTIWARQIQRNHKTRHRKVRLEHIQWGMAHSQQYGYNDWEKIAMISGLQKTLKPKAPRKGYGHHRGG